MSNHLVVTIILNTNRRDDTLAALGSLSQTTYPNHRVIVLDNASTDGSNDAIRSEFPDVQILELEDNLGYAGNNNVGISAALEQGADWVFILNEDTLVDSHCIQRLVEAAKDDPHTGVLGPLVYHFDEPEVIQSAGGVTDQYWRSFHLGQNEIDSGQYSGTREVDWISGCAILVKRQVVEQIGMLDERFFYYWEEFDWCLRARHNGWKIYCVSGAKLWHKGVKRDYLPSPNITYYATRNHFLLLAKHHAPFRTWLFSTWQTLRTLASWTLKPKWRVKRGHRDAMWQGIKDFLQKRWGMRSVQNKQL